MPVDKDWMNAMPEKLDVYSEWLGIEAKNRPLNHYQLLKLKQFEDNTGVIRKNYRQLNAHVRKYATGDYLEESQALLNELAKAMLCLTDAQRKADYDASLGRETAGPGRRRTFEQLMLANKIIDTEQLKQARSYAEAVGLDVHQAVLQKKFAKPAIIMLAYAESIGLPYIELSDIGVDETILPQIPPALGRQHSFVPVMIDDGQLMVAAPEPIIPDVEEELRLRTGMPVRTVICAPASINEAVQKYYPRDGGQAAAAAQAAAGGATPAAAAKPARASSGPMSEEDKKQQMQLSLIGGGWGMIGTALLLWYFEWVTSIFVFVPIAVVVGALVGLGIFFAMKK